MSELRFLPELELVEIERSREISRCCSGGGGRFWTEMVAEVLVTGCPFCVLNLEDSVKGRGDKARIYVNDMVDPLSTAIEHTPR